MNSHYYLDALSKLDFEKIAVRIRNYCSSDLGRELVDDLQPSTDCPSLIEELSRVTECKAILESDNPLPVNGIKDIRTALHRSAIEGGFLSPAELLSVGSTLKASRLIKSYLGKRSTSYPLLSKLGEKLFADKVLEYNIDQAIDSDGKMRDSASRDLKGIRRQIVVTYDSLRNKLVSILKIVTEEGLAQDEIITTRDGRMVIPVKVEHRHHVPGFVHSSSASGATVFIEPAETLDLNNEVRTLQFREQREIENILRALTGQVKEIRLTLLESVDLLARIDFVHAKARYSVEILGSQPLLRESGPLILSEARHPVLLQKHKFDEVIPLSVTLGGQYNTLIISGPNAGGKSVALMTVGLLCLMVQCAIHIPAGPESEFVLFEGVFVDIGDNQSIENDLSTFSSHLFRLKEILGRANERSLVLIDEIGAGTDPTEGGALAAAVLSELTERRALTVATTHHSALKVFAEEAEGVVNGAMEFDQLNLTPTYRFVLGVPGSSYALEIARRLGIPEMTLSAARRLLGEQAAKLEGLIASLEARSQKQKDQIDDLEREKARLAGLILLYQNKVSALEKAAKTIKSQAIDEARDLVEKANAAIERLVKEIRERNAGRDVVRAGREGIAALRDELVRAGEKFRVQEEPGNRPPVSAGTTVRLRGTSEVGEVLSVGDSAAEVLFGSMRMKVSTTELEVVDPKEISGRTRGRSTQEPPAQPAEHEVDLRGMAREEALGILDKFLDAAFLAGLNRVDVIHGKGTGALRKHVTEFLRSHPHVKSCRGGEWNEGGSGVTVVELLQ